MNNSAHLLYYIHPPTVDHTNNKDAIGRWVNAGETVDPQDAEPLLDTLESQLSEVTTGRPLPRSNQTRLQDFLLLNVRYLPTNLRDGIINTVDLAIEMEGYGGYSSTASQGSRYDVLMLPTSLPNVSAPTLRMDVDAAQQPSFFERQSTSLPATVIAKPNVVVVKGPSYYVCCSVVSAVVWCQL